MAWVERRERTATNGKRTVTYRVRWRETDGRARAKTFRRKVEADRFAAMVSADIVRGPDFRALVRAPADPAAIRSAA